MKWCSLQLRCSGGFKLFEGYIHELPLSEKNILALSVRYFNDPEPCYIHRSAVLNRIYNELNEFFKSDCTDGAGLMKTDCLPESVRVYFDMFEDVKEITVSANGK
jgi:hypothetical protein